MFKTIFEVILPDLIKNAAALFRWASALLFAVALVGQGRFTEGASRIIAWLGINLDDYVAIVSGWLTAEQRSDGILSGAVLLTSVCYLLVYAYAVNHARAEDTLNASGALMGAAVVSELLGSGSWPLVLLLVLVIGGGILAHYRAGVTPVFGTRSYANAWAMAVLAGLWPLNHIMFPATRVSKAAS